MNILFDLSTIAICLPHHSSTNPCREIDLHLLIYNRRQLDMYDDDGEAYITHDRSLWWAGSVYANDWSFTNLNLKCLGLVMAIVKQDSEEPDWDTCSMQHCPDDLDNGWSTFTQSGPAVQSIKPGWWIEKYFPEELSLE